MLSFGTNTCSRSAAALLKDIHIGIPKKVTLRVKEVIEFPFKGTKQLLIT
jgi:hypothetical protein